MNIIEVADLIRQAKSSYSDVPWTGYDITKTPFAVYDDDDVIYIDHPHPPLKRPDNLLAATSVDINGIQTATIPIAMCSTENEALPLIYHEGFHWFQYHHFEALEVDMFMAMAFYPELDASYRALCRIEEHVLSSEAYSAERKCELLGRLIALRRSRLQAHPSLLDYERFLERSEGTAHFVEQQIRKTHFDITPVVTLSGHGWSRFYLVGAAFCWLLEASASDWMHRIEVGESPGDILMTYADDTIDLAIFDYDAHIAEEMNFVSVLKNEIASQIHQLETPNAIRIRYASPDRVAYRAFSPMTLVSLGDGRILHRHHFTLMLPERGSIAIKEIPIIDHVLAGEIILPPMATTLMDGILRIQNTAVTAELSGVHQEGDGVFILEAE